MGKNRILLENGKFQDAPSKPKPVPVVKADKAPAENTQKENTSGGNPPNEPSKKIALSGDESVAELKAHLDTLNIAYAKNAGKEKCLELLAPHLETQVDGL